MILEVRHLNLVVAVAEEHSVTKAGNRLHLTQSAVSHQLKDIEERLGTRLFHRDRKTMVLTAAGERLLETARGVIAQLERAEEETRDIGAERLGRLRISTQCYTCYKWLPELLKLFSKEHPRVEVDIVVEATRHPVQALLEGKLDIALVSRLARDRRLAAKPLFNDELLAVMSPAHGLASKAYVTPEELAGERLLIHNSPGESTVFQSLFAPSGVSPQHVSQVQLTEAITEMAKAGLGVGVISKWAVREELEAGTLCGVRLGPKGLYRQWSAVTLKSEQNRPHLLKFVHLLASNTERITGQRPPAGRGAPRSRGGDLRRSHERTRTPKSHSARRP
jgi:LysR family transcriptional regulator for metE and metH